MFMIVLLHSGTHGRALTISDGLNFYSIWFHFVEALSISSVDVFVLISGYFLCTQSFRPSRLVNVYLAVLFYSLVWLFVLTIVFHDPFSIKNLIKALLPVSFNLYWFISSYIVMYLLSPILNVLVRSMKREQHLMTIVLLALLFSVWPSIIIGSTPTGISNVGDTAVWFVVLYLIAAYLRNYPIKKSRKYGLYYMVCAIAVLIAWILMVKALSVQSFVDEWRCGVWFYYYRYNSLPVLLSAVFLFLAFQQIRIDNGFVKKMILFVAPLTMGVYLIHDNQSARQIVWQRIQGLQATPKVVIIVLVYALMVFITCLMIEKIRTLVFSVLINKRRWYKSLMERLDAVPDYLKSYIVTKTQ